MVSYFTNYGNYYWLFWFLIMKERFNKYLEETFLLDYKHPSIQVIIKENKWQELDEKNKIKQSYLFVRDDIAFGYNEKDDIKASEVLRDGYGQCNTKSTLLMALLRALGIPCRLHGFTINKALQKGALSGIWYKLSPENILHSWVEVNYKDSWYNLEGVILDKKYLTELQNKYKNCSGTFCGYGVYTDDFQNPAIDWNENNTYIQKLGINQDFGIFDSPDDFYKEHNQNLNFFKRLAYKLFVRKLMNRNINKIRES